MHHPVLQRYLAKSLAANPNTNTVTVPLPVARRLIASLKREHAGQPASTTPAGKIGAAKLKAGAKGGRGAKTIKVAVSAPKSAMAVAKQKHKGTQTGKAVAKPGVEVKKQASGKVKAKKAVNPAKKVVASKVEVKAAKVAKKSGLKEKVESKQVVAKKVVKRGMTSRRKLYTIPGYATLSDRSRLELNRHYVENVRDMRVALLNTNGLQQFNGIGPVLEKEIKAWFAGAEVAARG